MTRHSPFLIPRRALSLLAALPALCGMSIAAEFPTDPLGWPAVTPTTKPWTRWWWLGSAVDAPNLTRELQEFEKAGIGGVEICPIYGTIGAESRFLKHLSTEWMEMLAHTTREGKRLGIGVDLTTGTGWPFGGPMVAPESASSSMKVVVLDAIGGKPLDMPSSKGKFQCLAAWPAEGPAIDLMPTLASGQRSWTPPPGSWKIIGIDSQSPIQKVKRAAPGGEGNVLDPFSASAMENYLKAFDAAFKDFNAPSPRAYFHDSFEYYGAAWTPAFLDRFRSARGYDLRDQLPAFAGIGDGDTVARVRADYRETLDELHLGYLSRWHDWAKARGGVTRNQAHGSPGNLLDHYAVSEIPETEIFRHVEDNQIPMLRFPASAAASNSGNLVSSESFTWLSEHFQVTPDQLKEAADFVFLAGVNHLFFHGIPYSPSDAPWPGWLFYASTHMGPNGGLWRDLPAFNSYITRCQSILQHGMPTSDVLLYFPIHDLWSKGEEKLPLFTVHDQDKWLWPTTFYQTTMELWNHGITFDYLSDRMTSRLTVKDGKILLGSNSFSALVIPGVTRMQPEIQKQLLAIAAAGGRVIIQNGWPSEVPGFHDHENRTAALRAMQTQDLKNVTRCEGSILPALSPATGVRHESMTSAGLRFIRRRTANGYHYFIVNRSKSAFDAVVSLGVPFACAARLDPWTGSINVLAKTDQGVALQLPPGASTILRTFDRPITGGTPWTRFPDDAASFTLEGPWQLKFIEGGPALPAPAQLKSLGSWTSIGAEDTRNFSGTASYTTQFDLKCPLTRCQIDLGTVKETASVFINDHPAGISWCSPHRLDISPWVKDGPNTIRVEVTNLAANRIADLDRRKVAWKQFHEINFVNIEYKLFDASSWDPLPSGLLGPVRIYTSTR